MLHLDYIGLLNTDHQRQGPVQMFLQGRESRARYVLGRVADLHCTILSTMLLPLPKESDRIRIPVRCPRCHRPCH